MTESTRAPLAPVVHENGQFVYAPAPATDFFTREREQRAALVRLLGPFSSVAAALTDRA